MQAMDPWDFFYKKIDLIIKINVHPLLAFGALDTVHKKNVQMKGSTKLKMAQNVGLLNNG